MGSASLGSIISESLTRLVERSSNQDFRNTCFTCLGAENIGEFEHTLRLKIGQQVEKLQTNNNAATLQNRQCNSDKRSFSQGDIDAMIVKDGDEASAASARKSSSQPAISAFHPSDFSPPSKSQLISMEAKPGNQDKDFSEDLDSSEDWSMDDLSGLPPDEDDYEAPPAGSSSVTERSMDGSDNWNRRHLGEWAMPNSHRQNLDHEHSHHRTPHPDGDFSDEDHSLVLEETGSAPDQCVPSVSASCFNFPNKEAGGSVLSGTPDCIQGIQAVPCPNIQEWNSKDVGDEAAEEGPLLENSESLRKLLMSLDESPAPDSFSPGSDVAVVPSPNLRALDPDFSSDSES